MNSDPSYTFLFEALTQLVPLSKEELELVSTLFYKKILDKKEHWLNPGECCSEVIFVTKGCLRYYYQTDNVERTGEFYFEGSWFTDFESWLTKRPAIIGVDAMEFTELLAIKHVDLEYLYKVNPKCERIGRLLAEATVVSLCNRYNSLLAVSPQKRYIELVEKKSPVINRIPQHYIASYLGIEPESLSRIRKKLSRIPVDF